MTLRAVSEQTRPVLMRIYAALDSIRKFIPDIEYAAEKPDASPSLQALIAQAREALLVTELPCMKGGPEEGDDSANPFDRDRRRITSYQARLPELRSLQTDLEDLANRIRQAVGMDTLQQETARSAERRLDTKRRSL